MRSVPFSSFDSLLAMPDAIFTRQDALRTGVTDEVLTAGCRRGEIVRLTRGAYTRPGAWSTGEHRRLLARAALRLYPDAVLASGAAVEAHGVATFQVPVVRTDVCRPIRREALTEHLRIRPLRETTVSTSWGPATPLPISLAQLTMDHGISSGVASIDAAMHDGLVTKGELDEVFQAWSGRPRSSRLRCALAWADGAAESLGESITRTVLLGAGLRVESQAVIADQDGVVIARVDLRIAGTPVLVEFDGKVKYADGGPDALFREKRREDRLRALGYIVVRVTWADLFVTDRIVSAVTRAMTTVAQRSA